MNSEVQHTSPIWRKKADAVIGAKVTDATWKEQYEFEQLAAQSLGDSKYMICCIPFALYDLFLGDVVLVDGDLNVSKVLERSGHLGFRVATQDRQQQDALINSLGDDYAYEIYSDSLLALDAPDPEAAAGLAQLLQAAEDEDSIREYETIKSA